MGPAYTGPVELAAKNSSSWSPTCVPAGTASEWLVRLPLLLLLATNRTLSASLVGLAVLVIELVAPLLSVTFSVTTRSPASAYVCVVVAPVPCVVPSPKSQS